MYVTKYGATIPISRETALQYGLVEPTEDERLEQQERSARWDAEVHQRRIATTEWLRSMVQIADPLSRALLDLHSRSFDSDTCAECVRDELDHEDWPCNTVRLITQHHGHPAPDWCEFT